MRSIKGFVTSLGKKKIEARSRREMCVRQRSLVVRVPPQASAMHEHAEEGHMIRSIATLAVLSSIFMAPAAALADAYGDPVIVNKVTAGDQNLGGVNTSANGDSMVWWWDVDTGYNALEQRQSAAGVVLQSQEWSLGSAVADIAQSASGSFAVTRVLSDGSGTGIYVTVYDRNGGVTISQFRVNDTMSGDQNHPVIAMNADGRFVVAWENAPTHRIHVKGFLANGTPAFSEKVMSTWNSMDAAAPDIGIDAGGNFTVTYLQRPSWSAPANDVDIYAISFHSYGEVIQTYRVNTKTADYQGNPRIAMNAAGKFVIVWINWTSPTGSTYDVRGQYYDVFWYNKVGGELVIPTAAIYWLPQPQVAMAGDGSFMAVWDDDNQAGPVDRVMARSYNPSASPLGNPFTISTNSAADSERPLVGMDPEGNATVAWRQYNSTTSSYDIYARRYQPAGVVVQTVTNGATLTGLSGSAGGWKYYKVTVPAGHNTVSFTISGGTGDADLYVRYGAVPTATRWDGRPYLNGNNESVNMLNFPPGDWYIGINGYIAYSSLNLKAISY